MITVARTKLHLRIDHNDENELIEELIEAATEATADYLNMTAAEVLATMPAPVNAAILLLIGDLYENRELQADRQLYSNDTYERLLNPYRVMSV